MNRGSTWGDEEIRFLIEIWSDDYIKTQLERIHKNNETFNLFSERMRERGFDRTGEQCHLKVKKLRQQDMKTRDAMRRSGASTNEKEKFHFFDELDSILGTRPTSSPVCVVESTPASTSTSESELASADMTSDSGK